MTKDLNRLMDELKNHEGTPEHLGHESCFSQGSTCMGC